MKLRRKVAVPRVGVVIAAVVLAFISASVRADVCEDFREQIALLESLKENTRQPDYANAAKTLAATGKTAIGSIQAPLETADLAAIAASGKSVTSAIVNRNASNRFLEASLIVFQGVRSEIDAGRFTNRERAAVLVETIVAASGFAIEALRAVTAAQHDTGIAFHRTLYAAVCR